MKKNINSILSFILIPISYLWITLTIGSNYIGTSFSFLNVSLDYIIRNISINIFYYSGLIIPIILILLSIFFGIKYLKSKEGIIGYRILSILSVLISIFTLIMWGFSYFTF